MNRKACAEFLGVSVRTVRYWDAGRCRVPWSAVRLLRLARLGGFGALNDNWAGWTINRNGLWSPDGKHYPEPAMRRWWITCEQARFWRETYDRSTAEVCGSRPRGGALDLEADLGWIADRQLVSSHPPHPSLPPS